MAITEKYYYDNVKNYVNSNKGYTLITEEKDYKNSRTKILIHHDECNTDFYCTTYHFFLMNSRCPKCNKAKYFPENKGTDRFKKELFDVCGNEYTLIGEYINSSKKVKLLHSVCGKIYEVTPNHFLHSNSRCIHCNNISKGERKIEKILNENQIQFRKEYSFKNLWNENHTAILEFDFAIFQNNNFKCLIEFDGQQHFQKVFPLNGTDKEKEDAFIRTKCNDERKNIFCKENKIPLFRITYKDNIEEKVKNILERLNDYPNMEYTFK